MADRVLSPGRRALGWTGLALIVLLAAPSAVRAQLAVDAVLFEGNQAFTDKELRKVTRVENMGALRALFAWTPFFGKPRFNYLVAARDVTFLQAFYRNRGYLQARVEQRTRQLSETELAVTYIITEGLRTTLSDVIFSGNETYGDQRLQSQLDENREAGLRPNLGDPVSGSAIQAATLEIVNLYRAEGHYFARVRPSIGARDSTTGSSAVTFTIREGPIVRVEDVDVDGNRHTKRYIITREVTLDPGDLLTEPDRMESQRRLFGTGIFRTVNVMVGEISPDSTRARVRVTVTERPRRYIGLGAGFAHEEEAQVDVRFRGNGQWGHRNLYGTGRAIEFTAAGDFQVITAWQPIQQELSLRYIEPWFFGARTPLTASFSLRPQQYDIYEVQEFAVELGLRREFTRHTVGWLNFSYRLVDTKQVPIEDLSVKEALRGISGQIERDSRDLFISPSHGSLTRLRTQHYGGILGGPDYDRFSIEWARYRTSGRRTVMATRLKLGIASPRGGTGQIPIFDRFFAGGNNTVRGYNERELGPVVETTDEEGATRFEPVGGRVLFLANLEFRRPRVAGPFGTKLFVDIGNVWSRGSDVDGRLAYSAGIGVFLDTPLGPLWFDYGWRLNRSAVERDTPGYRLSPGRLHFGVLHAF
jgi:outer membrane protein assembly complex protein YaeT